MPASEPDTTRGLPFTAKLVVGLLAVVGLVSIVRWIINGLFGLLFFAVVLGVLYVAVRALLRR
ncbi:MAG: hypothetical protein GEV08_12430 [Acidimicrobiia bacterium]|nr:hypothetical protein [Acidimicrobiia bacterium]